MGGVAPTIPLEPPVAALLPPVAGLPPVADLPPVAGSPPVAVPPVADFPPAAGSPPVATPPVVADFPPVAESPPVAAPPDADVPPVAGAPPVLFPPVDELSPPAAFAPPVGGLPPLLALRPPVLGNPPVAGPPVPLLVDAPPLLALAPPEASAPPTEIAPPVLVVAGALSLPLHASGPTKLARINKELRLNESATRHRRKEYWVSIINDAVQGRPVFRRRIEKAPDQSRAWIFWHIGTWLCGPACQKKEMHGESSGAAQDSSACVTRSRPPAARRPESEIGCENDACLNLPCSGELDQSWPKAGRDFTKNANSGVQVIQNRV